MTSAALPKASPKAGFLRRRFARWAGDKSGATAVEFAIVVTPLIFMLFSILELAAVFLVTATLDNATNDAARAIRTGATQTSGGGSATTLRDSICAKLGWLQSTCAANLTVDVRTYSQFSNQAAPSPVTNTNTFDPKVLAYSAGSQGDIVLVRAFYQWQLITPYLYGGLQKLSGGKDLIIATATFRNEPY